MKSAIVYGTRNGATAEASEKIARVLREKELTSRLST